MPLYITALGLTSGRIEFTEIERNACEVKINFYLCSLVGNNFNKHGMPKGYQPR
ncbi:hypothetical protein [uncultured Dysgonomonas sp.]|uniref:hypothetical protein n=1 Tax=uncultured Dysgonomonas sp. TaxID=206096 RepID=UPI000B318572|nr:hypothetical protein [uncultured Dysgonomonas sp.]